ncbi:uncharacterized protein LOC135843902 isoform X2 [Planococcus citri]|uniref:uncharacterized protein LOC135843902 isoform X2 n=1 Tax=Planococcus citri TaxID=170843 RepID=UPI0031F846F9
MLPVGTIIFLYWLSIPSTQCAQWALALKDPLHEYSISMGATSFKDLVTKSSVFVDKTLFIRDVLNNPDESEIILCPQQWGRTMNLDMLKNFLEIRVNARGRRLPRHLKCPIYRFFVLGEVQFNKNDPLEYLTAPLLISNYTMLIEDYLGNYPVIYLSLKDVVGNSYLEVKRRLQHVLSRAFRQHKYLVNVYRKKNNTITMAKFTDHLYPRDSTDVAGSLNYLCELLYDTYKQKVFILIDDHDAPIQSALQNSNMDKNDYGPILDLLESLFKWTLVQNPYLHRGIAMGVFRLGKNLIKSWLEYKLRRVGHSNHPMLDHFGFTETEVEMLFDRFDVKGDLAKQARLWYCGHWSLNLKQQLYNPVSVVNFLSRKMLTNVYHERGTFHFLQPIISSAPTFRTYMLLLLSDQYINITKPPTMDHDRIRALQEAYKGTYRKRNVVIMLSYFLSKGFLIIEPHNFHQSRLPNYEIASEFSTAMITYYRRRYPTDLYWFHKACIRMYNYVQDDFIVIYDFEQDLQNIMESIADFQTYAKNSTEFEVMVRSVFNAMFLFVQRLSHYKYRIYYNRVLSGDYVLTHEQQQEAALIVLKVNEPNLDSVLEEAKSYKHVLYNLPRVKYMKFIGIDVFDNYTVRLISRTQVRVQSDRNFTRQPSRISTPTRIFIEEQ